MIPVPVITQFNVKPKTVSLWFHQDVRGWNGEYWIRGGISWPEQVTTEAGLDFHGYAVVGGIDIIKQTLTIFAETSFKCVDHFITHGSNMIEIPGLCTWLNEVRNKYCCDSFYYQSSPDEYRVYAIQIHKSAMIQPKPHFTEVHADSAHMSSALVSWVGTGKLTCNAGDGFEKGLRQYEASVSMGVKNVIPAVKAVQALCVGLDRHPTWRGIGR